MSAVVIEAHLRDANGVPADDSINTFTFATSDAAAAPAGLAADMFPLLQLFYNGVSAALSLSLPRTDGYHHMVAYELAPTGTEIPALPLGGPIATSNLTLSAASGSTDIPRECAAVLSLQAPHAGVAEDTPGGAPGPAGDTHPAARLRGRLYIGPLNVAAVGAGANGVGIAAGVRTAITSAAADLMTAANLVLAGTSFWAVWSRKNNAVYPITSGWMDDAFDTQRRRGIKATARTTFG
jgi:hypothetical protein